MARWAPKDSDPIGPNEHIGRRLFDEPKLSGAPDQKPYKGLELRHFEETRADREFSVDRLGKTSIENAVVRYVKDRCLHEAKKFTKPKRFDGWAYVAAKNLSKWPIKPSAIRKADSSGAPEEWSEKDLDQNRFHAHIEMPEDDYLFAYEVREKFLNLGGVHRARPPHEPMRVRAKKLVDWAWREISSLWKKQGK